SRRRPSLRSGAAPPRGLFATCLQLFILVKFQGGLGPISLKRQLMQNPTVHRYVLAVLGMAAVWLALLGAAAAEATRPGATTSTSIPKASVTNSAKGDAICGPDLSRDQPASTRRMVERLRQHAESAGLKNPNASLQRAELYRAQLTQSNS